MDSFNEPADRELLGEVRVPSGQLVLLDMGQLNLWSHDRPPDLSAEANNVPGSGEVDVNGADFRIEGPDAKEAGRLFDRQYNPFYVYDMLAEDEDWLAQKLQQTIQPHGLKAKLVRLEKRVSHRERVRLTLEHCDQAGEFVFHGVPAVALGNLPTDRTLPIYGERMQGEPALEGRWRHVYLECQPVENIAESEEIGYVGVDHARIILADADALGSWSHDVSLDGLADFVFWGQDAEQAAEETGAERIDESHWGWVDTSVEEILIRGMEVEQLLRDQMWKAVVDFRPHSHHNEVMRQVRSSATQSGTLDIGDAKLCGFLTSYGDGFYPVHRDLDEQGQLVRARIELGCEEIVERFLKVLTQHSRES